MPIKGYKQSAEHINKRRGSNNYQWNPDGTTIEKRCESCGILFNARKRDIKRGRGKYCSRRCLAQYGSTVGAMNRKIWKNIKNEAQHIEMKSVAYKLYNAAVRNGTIVKKPCEICGSTLRVAGHHEDYSDPLNVRWLCAKHHVLLHYRA